MRSGRVTARRDMRMSEEQYAAETAKRTRWQRGSEVVNTQRPGADSTLSPPEQAASGAPSMAKADAGSGPTSRSATVPVAEQNSSRPDTASSHPSKYRNVKTDGYASRKESRRAGVLLLMQEAGHIRNLREQVPYVLIPRQLGPDGKVQERACGYVADFVYQEFSADGWRDVVEDCKGLRTDVYIIKRKLLRFTHGIVVRET